MCKVLAVAGVKKTNRKALKTFIKNAAEVMSVRDNHGLGYAAINSTGLCGERWVKNADAFKHRIDLTLETNEVRKLKSILEIVPGAAGYNSFGTIDKSFADTSAVILHTRMATTGAINVTNTHPFVSGDTALIHNGMISNHAQLVKKYSDCDSETILNEYLDYDVDKTPKNIGEMIPNLEGWFACAVLTKDGHGRWVMDIFRNSGANLVLSYVAALDAIVFATTEDIIERACKASGFKAGKIFEVADGKLARVDAKTAIGITMENFNPKVNYGTRWNANQNQWEREENEYLDRVMGVDRIPSTYEGYRGDDAKLIEGEYVDPDTGLTVAEMVEIDALTEDDDEFDDADRALIDNRLARYGTGDDV